MPFDLRGKLEEDKAEKKKEYDQDRTYTRWYRKGRNFICPRCGVHTSSDKMFCTDCGAKLPS